MLLSALPENFRQQNRLKMFYKQTVIVLTINLVCDIINTTRMEVS